MTIYTFCTQQMHAYASHTSASMPTHMSEHTLSTGPAAAGLLECTVTVDGPDCQAAWDSVANTKDKSYEREFYNACDRTGYWGPKKEPVSAGMRVECLHSYAHA